MSNLYVSEDLLIDVLVRLPLKSLIQFKCVSKSWSALIGSHEFIKKHLNQSLIDPKAHEIIIGSDSDSTGCTQSYSLYAAEIGSPENLSAPTKELYNIKGRRIKGIGSCNGLLCLQYSKYGVLLCNPWTRKHSRIRFARVETELYPGCRTKFVTYGFGYDDVHDDYKVVRFVQFLNKSFIIHGHEVKVYSLKSNSWKTVSNFPYRISNTSDSGVLANSALHWVFQETESTHAGSIVAIDLGTEEFRLLPLPVFSTINLRVLNGCLCVFPNIYPRYLNIGGTMHLEMWVMKEYGIEDSWTKVILELPFGVNVSFLNPISYSESDKQLVLRHYWPKFLFYCDIEKKSVEIVESPGSPTNLCDMYPIVRSLVEPDGGLSYQVRRRRSKKSM